MRAGRNRVAGARGQMRPGATPSTNGPTHTRNEWAVGNTFSIGQTNTTPVRANEPPRSGGQHGASNAAQPSDRRGPPLAAGRWGMPAAIAGVLALVLYGLLIW